MASYCSQTYPVRAYSCRVGWVLAFMFQLVRFVRDNRDKDDSNWNSKTDHVNVVDYVLS